MVGEPMPLAVDESVGGGRSDYGLGGYQYGGNAVDQSLIWQQEPLTQYNGDTDGLVTIGDRFGESHPEALTDSEGSVAKWINGAAYPVDAGFSEVQGRTNGGGRTDDMKEQAWSGTGPTPYQFDRQLQGPASGNSENTLGTTSQPDYVAFAQYGVSTGGGTGKADTIAGYYQDQVGQAVAEYTASAFFAST